MLVVSGTVNVFSDLLNITLPLWAIWHLQMAPKRKAGVSAVFTTGLLYFILFLSTCSDKIAVTSFMEELTNRQNSAFVSSICRLVYTTHILASSDIFYIIAQIGLWAYVILSILTFSED